MTCRRICRELLWLTRFGEVGVDSAPHLDHLSGCRSCRDEVGFDRAMVQRLREALAARVADADPSPTTWERIVARAQAPEPASVRLWEWSTALVARLRVATGMAFASLALILALNTQLVPAGTVTDADGSPSLSGMVAGPAPRSELGIGVRPAFDGSRGRTPGSTGPEAAPWEPFVPPGIGALTIAAPPAEEPAVEEAPADTFVLVFDLIEQPAPAAPAAEEPEPEQEPAPTVSPEPGVPS
jgi:hypothetical protein